MVAPYFIVFLLGALTGLSELLSRYRNIIMPFILLPGIIYLGINGLASTLSYFIVDRLASTKDQPEYLKIFVAGFSAMALLRSSFLVYKSKNSEQSIPIGLGIVVQVFLDWADRRFDQKKSSDEISEISRIMAEVDFLLAKDELIALATFFMENVTDSEKSNLVKIGEELVTLKMSNLSKSISLGKSIAKITDIELLEKVVEQYKKNQDTDPFISFTQKLNQS